MSRTSKATARGAAARPTVRLSMRHFTPRPTKPGVGRPASGARAARVPGGGGRP